MRVIDQALIDWAVQKIKTEYPEDVSLLIGQKGACKIPTDNQGVAFDYFIPATDRGYNLAKTFIIEGMGYDLYPMSWERVEGIAEVNERLTFCLAEGEILYARNEADRNHFLSLQQKLREHLMDTEFTYHKALEKINMAMELFQTMVFDGSISHVRKAAGGIVGYLAQAIALANGTYLKQDIANRITSLSELRHIPENFIGLYKAIIEARNIKEIKTRCYEILEETRAFFINLRVREEKEDYNHNFEDLAAWYEEGRYTWRRLYYYCEQQDAENCFGWGSFFQIELDAIKEDFNLETMDLMGVFDARDLSTFRKRAEAIESYVRMEINKHGATIHDYSCLEDFLNAEG